MLKLTKLIYTDESGKDMIIEVPSGFQIQIPCSSEECAIFATGALIARGYIGIGNVFLNKEE